MEKLCGGCLFCNSNNYCLPKSSSVSPMRKGCNSWLPKDKPSSDDVTGPPPEIKEQAQEEKPPAKTKSRKGVGGRKSKIDIAKLKKLYNEGALYKEMPKQLGVSSQGTIGYQISKLIESGELIKRRERHPKRTTKQPTKKVAKLTAPLEVLSMPNEQSSENKICSQCGQDVRHSKDYYEFKRKYESLPDEKRHEVYRYLQFLQFNQKGE